jgi:hypothetical protein
MDARPFDVVRQDLSRASALYGKLQTHFERFCTEARRLQDAGSALRGVKISREGRALVLDFLDRRQRVTFEFDRKAEKGFLHLENISRLDRGVDAATLTRIAFDSAGETDIGGGCDGGKLQLAILADCKALAVCFIDAGLDHEA